MRVEESRDKLIGQNVQRLRGDTSQKDLADEMRKRGWKWSQATVWSVEQGERPIRLAEAESLADFWLLESVDQLLVVPMNHVFFDALSLYEKREHELRSAALSLDVDLYKVAAIADEWIAVGGEKDVEPELIGVDFRETPIQALERLLNTLDQDPRTSLEKIMHKGRPKGPHLKAYFGDDDGEHKEAP